MNRPKSALIVGGANTVFADYQEAMQLNPKFDYIIAINDAGTEFEDATHWVSMHPEKMVKWLLARREKGYKDPLLWTANTRRPPNSLRFNQIRNTRGGSGLLAIYVARYLHAQKIVLAGVPMDGAFEHYHTPGRWKECKLYRNVWASDKSLKVNDDVRSLSGWTKEQYGMPTQDWFLI